MRWQQLFLVLVGIVFAGLLVHFFYPDPDSLWQEDTGSESIALNRPHGASVPVELNESVREQDVVDVPSSPNEFARWWESESFLARAAVEYPGQLDKARMEVDRFRNKSTGREHLIRQLSRGSRLFGSKEFPLNLEDFHVEGNLKWADMGNSLSTIAANWQKAGQSLFDLEEEKRAGLVRSINKRPMDYPPLMVLEAVTNERMSELNSAFVLEAKELYLRELPRLGDAKRVEGIGSSAAWATLIEVGLPQENINDSWAHLSKLSLEMVDGQEQVTAILRDFMIDFEALVSRNYY